LRESERVFILDRGAFSSRFLPVAQTPLATEKSEMTGRDFFLRAPSFCFRTEGCMELLLSIISLALAVYDRYERELEKRKQKRKSDS
jgi:hypothetical protein